MTSPVPIRGPRIQHDGEITIAIGKNRFETQWKNEKMLWSTLLQRVSSTHRTHETLDEYQQMTKREQDEVKDIGGFVGGAVHGGRRVSGAVQLRHVIALDADFVKGDFWASVSMLFDHACLIYSTHSHRPDRPRLRLLIPLSRPVTPDEYQAVSRWIANMLGIDQFDASTFEVHRLMYWPSSPVDGEYIFEYQDLPWVNPDNILAHYEDWRDPSFWPEPEHGKAARQREAERAEDPHEKRGIVGAFCRSYSIQDAIETFLTNVYTLHSDGRYTYKSGSTAGGLVLYENGKFAYSHHGTDPIGGRLVNAFDLVRIHKFGKLDDDAKEGTPVVRLPSYTAMSTLAAEDDAVRKTLGQERMDQAAEDFGDVPTDSSGASTDWMAELEMTKSGDVRSTRHNILTILENDPRLKGRIALNEFTGRPAVLDDLPWRDRENRPNWHDRDDDGLRYYLERLYGLNSPTKTNDALGVLLERRKYHPVRDYLNSLEWDGQPRAETLFIDYLGAADTPYVRAVTRKALTAAVARIMAPGCKYDYMIVLVGPQGLGKSLILNKIGKQWFSDSLTTVQGKEAYEQLQGAWIIEMGELAATRRAETEAIKHFLTKREDIYRVAYGRQVSVFPRQCVFFGSTNDDTFLRDRTGNRRFWPVAVGGRPPARSIWADLTDDEIDQLWAEAVQLYKEGEQLYLPRELEQEAQAVQAAHTEESELAGPVREFLDKLLPEDWGERDLAARRQYLHGSDFGTQPEGTMPRTAVCVMEVWVEALGGDPKHMRPVQAREIHDIIRNTPGWKPHDSSGGRMVFPIHGRQRAYVREAVDDEGDFL